MIQTYGKKLLVFMVFYMAVKFISRQSFVPEPIKSLLA